MSTPSAFDTRMQNQNCCFWVKHSESCTQAKHMTAAIVVALTTIALLSGVLYILVQRGYFAGINSITQLIEPKWVYLGMGLAATVLAIDITFILVQVRSYLNKAIPHEEVHQSFFQRISHEELDAQLVPQSFKVMMSDETPTQFMLLIKDANRCVSYIAYRDLDDADIHQKRLLEQGFHDIEAIQSRTQEYSLQYIKGLVGEECFREIEEEFAEKLIEGCYSAPPKPLNKEDAHGLSIWMLGIQDADGVHMRSYKSEHARAASIQADYSRLTDIDIIIEWVDRACDKLPLAFIRENEYWPFETENPHALNCVIYQIPDEDDLTFRYYHHEPERAQFIGGSTFKDNNAKVRFNKSHTYSPEEVRDLVTKESLKWFDECVVDPHQYGKFILPMIGSETDIYGLKVAGINEAEQSGIEVIEHIRYFKSDVALQKHIDVHLSKTHVNVALVKEAAQKVHGNLANVVLETAKDYLQYNINEHFICIEYRDGETIQQTLLRESEVAPFKRAKDLENNRTEEICKDGCYSEKFGRALVAKYFPDGSHSEETLLEQVRYLSQGEYTTGGGPADCSFSKEGLPSVAIAAVKPRGEKEIQFLYFSSAEKRTQVCLEDDLKDGCARIQHIFNIFHFVGEDAYTQQKEDPQPVFAAFSSPDGQTVSFLTYTREDEVSIDYLTPEEMSEKLGSMMSTHFYTKEELLNGACTQAETRYLNSQIKTLKEYCEGPDGLQPMQFLDYRLHNGYIALFVRHEDTENKLNAEIHYFRDQTQDYHNRIGFYDSKKYQQVVTPKQFR